MSVWVLDSAITLGTIILACTSIIGIVVHKRASREKCCVLDNDISFEIVHHDKQAEDSYGGCTSNLLLKMKVLADSKSVSIRKARISFYGRSQTTHFARIYNGEDPVLLTGPNSKSIGLMLNPEPFGSTVDEIVNTLVDSTFRFALINTKGKVVCEIKRSAIKHVDIPSKLKIQVMPHAVETQSEAERLVRALEDLGFLAKIKVNS